MQTIEYKFHGNKKARGKTQGQRRTSPFHFLNLHAWLGVNGEQYGDRAKEEVTVSAT